MTLALGRSEEYKLPNQQQTVQYGVNLDDTKVNFANKGYAKAQVTRGMIGKGTINNLTKKIQFTKEKCEKEEKRNLR
jgi:hypothetical protein